MYSYLKSISFLIVIIFLNNLWYNNNYFIMIKVIKLQYAMQQMTCL